MKKFTKGFGDFPVLKERGFSILINVSGKLYLNKKLSLKDVDANVEEWGANKYIYIYNIYIYIFIFIYISIYRVKIS